MIKTRKNKKLKTTEERQQFVKKVNGDEPTIGPENYNVDMGRYLNYHNQQTPEAVVRKWALEYVKKNSKGAEKVLTVATDFELRSIGLLGHAKTNEYFLSEKHLAKLEADISVLVEKYKAVKEVIAQEKPVVSVQDRINALASQHIGEINGAIDEYLTEGKSFSMKGYLETNTISAPVAKKIGEALAPQLAEIKEAIEGKDAQLVEGYSFLTKAKLKRYAAFKEHFICGCRCPKE